MNTNFKLNFSNNNTIFRFILFIWIMSIPFKNSVYQISVGLIVVYFLWHLNKTKNFEVLLKNLKPTKYLTIGFLLIIICMVISNSINTQYTSGTSWHLMFMFIFRYGLVFVILAYFYRLNFFEKRDLTRWLFYSFIFLSSTGIYQIATHVNVLSGSGILGTLNNRNAFGLFMGMGFVLSLLLIKNYKILGFALLCLFSFLMIFTFSRSSWVASLSSTMVVFILNYKKIRPRDYLYLLIFLSLIFLVYSDFHSFQKRIEQLLDGYSSGRTKIWLHTIELIKEKIYFGYGLLPFRKLPDLFLNRYPDPHNMTLEILVSTGIFGLFSAFFTIFIILSKIVKNKNFLLLPIATYFLVVTQFDFGAFASKEILSFLTIFVFFVYSEDFKGEA